MGEIIAWLDQYQINLGAILRSTAVLVAAVLVISLLKRVLPDAIKLGCALGAF